MIIAIIVPTITTHV